MSAERKKHANPTISGTPTTLSSKMLWVLTNYRKMLPVVPQMGPNYRKMLPKLPEIISKTTGKNFRLTIKEPSKNRAAKRHRAPGSDAERHPRDRGPCDRALELGGGP